MSGLDIENRHIRQYRQFLSLQLRLINEAPIERVEGYIT